jgi:hypothetical protein
LTVTAVPATVNWAARGGPELAATVKVKVVEPLPVFADAVIQLGRLLTVHAHAAPVWIVTEGAPPELATESVVGVKE